MENISKQRRGEMKAEEIQSERFSCCESLHSAFKELNNI